MVPICTIQINDKFYRKPKIEEKKEDKCSSFRTEKGLIEV